MNGPTHPNKITKKIQHTNCPGPHTDPVQLKEEIKGVGFII